MMRNGFFLIAAVAAMVCSASLAQAQTVLYDMEPSGDGFGPNGGGVTVTTDTIGATSPTTSIKVDVVTGATFVGALTGSVAAGLANPPGLDKVTFDLTIDTGDEFAGGFAVVGVTIFGASQPTYPGGQLFGLQAQFADFEHIGGKSAGTYEVAIDLTSATHPLTFAAAQNFNQIFGYVGSGINDIIPTGFQLFFNKSSDAPLTVYFDNVVGYVPEPATGLLLCIGMVGVGLVARRKQ